MKKVELDPSVARLASLIQKDREYLEDRDQLFRVHMEISEHATDPSVACICDGRKMVVCDLGLYVGENTEELTSDAELVYPNYKMFIDPKRNRACVGQKLQPNSEVLIHVNPRLLGDVLICMADLLEGKGHASEVVLGVPVLEPGQTNGITLCGPPIESRVRAVVMPIRRGESS